MALGLLTVVVYAPVRHHTLLLYDDNAYVTMNQHVTQGLTPASVAWAFTGIHQSTWHPLTSLSHILDYQLFGLNPGPHHLGNVLLHVLNTLLLFGVLARMTGQPWRSACVAGLFALHPLHVESVAWVAERKDVLSACFWMLTLWAYVGYVRHPSVPRYAWVLAAFVGALLSKPMAVTLPLVLVLLDVWPLRRTFLTLAEGTPHVVGQRSVQVSDGRVSLATLLIEKLPLLVLAGIDGVITIAVQQRGGGFRLEDTRLTERAANAVVSYAAYLGKTIWPSRLAVFYPFEGSLPAWQVFGATLLLAAATVLVWWAWPRFPYLLTGWLWYMGTLAPVIGLLPVGDQAMADRFTYVPLIGIFIVAAWGIPDLLAGWKFGQVVCVLIATLALAVCTVLTARQLRYWHDTLSLFQHALSVTSNNYLAHVNIAMALVEQGRDDKVFEHLSEAVRVKPSHAPAQYDLGLLLDQRGDHTAAKAHYLAALQADPRYSQAHNNLGNILAAEGDLAGAVAHYRAALQVSPGLSEARQNLNNALQAMGQH